MMMELIEQKLPFLIKLLIRKRCIYMLCLLDITSSEISIDLKNQKSMTPGLKFGGVKLKNAGVNFEAR